MKAPISYLIAGVVLVLSPMLNVAALPAQTTQATTPDTIHQNTTKLPAVEDSSRLELPDVLIYGIDRSVRLPGDKLASPFEDAKLVAPMINYQPLLPDLTLKNQKRYIESPPRGIGSRTLLHLDVGRFQRFNVEAGHWRETENHHYSFYTHYDRNQGQYDNSQYYQGSLQAQFGIRTAPNLMLSSLMSFRLADYGLYGAQLADLHRHQASGKIQVDAQWSLTNERSANFSTYFQQHHSQDADGNSLELKSRLRTIGLASSYQTGYRTIPIYLSGLFENQTWYDITGDATNAQNFLQLKAWTSIKIKTNFIIKPGFIFENLDVNDSLSQYQIWPDLEIIAMPIARLGLLFKISKEFSPMNYADLCEKNPFISSETNYVPMRRELELRAALEFTPSNRLSFSSAITRQHWRDYAFWFRESSIGLFQLTSVDQVDLTILNFQTRFQLSQQASVDAGFQFHFDSIKKDTLLNAVSELPYLERFRIPIHFEYKINPVTRGLASLVVVGPRSADLKDDQKLASFGLLSFSFERQLIKHLSVFVEGNNLLNQKYEIWQNYPGMGIYVGIGVRGSW